jgi:hypothetical protein
MAGRVASGIARQRPYHSLVGAGPAAAPRSSGTRGPSGRINLIRWSSPSSPNSTRSGPVKVTCRKAGVSLITRLTRTRNGR